MADITRGVRLPKRPRNPGQLDLVEQRISFDSFTKSVVHFNGSDGETTIVDALDHIWTSFGNVQIDTDQSKFGGASGRFDGSGDYIRGDGHADYSFGTGDFTVDFWVRYTSSTAGILYDSRNDASGTARNTIFCNGTNFQVFIMAVGAVITSSTVPSLNVWYHVALVRSSGVTKLYINGTQEGSSYTDSNNYVCPANRPTVGADGAAEGTSSINGWIDELRVSKGVARWTSNFTPPTSEYS